MLIQKGVPTPRSFLGRQMATGKDTMNKQSRLKCFLTILSVGAVTVGEARLSLADPATDYERSWGANTRGQLCLGTMTPFEVSPKLSLLNDGPVNDVERIDGGGGHLIGLMWGGIIGAPFYVVTC